MGYQVFFRQALQPPTSLSFRVTLPALVRP